MNTQINSFTSNIGLPSGVAAAQAVGSTWTKEREPADRSSITRTRELRFNKLIAGHIDDVYKFAYWLSGNQTVAEDVTQETLMRAWKSFDNLKDAKAAKSWLLTTVRRENARYFARRHPQETEMPDEKLIAGPADYDTSTEAFVLRRALHQLPLEYREPLVMQVLYGYSTKEIAVRLDLSDAAANTRLYRARRKMRDLLVARRNSLRTGSIRQDHVKEDRLSGGRYG